MRDKKDFLDAFLDISPPIFTVRQENNEVDREVVSLNDRVIQFVRDINTTTSIDEDPNIDATLNET